MTPANARLVQAATCSRKRCATVRREDLVDLLAELAVLRMRVPERVVMTEHVPTYRWRWWELPLIYLDFAACVWAGWLFHG